jgi:hypothetical protein
MMSIQFGKKNLLKGERKICSPKRRQQKYKELHSTPTTLQIHGKSYKPSRISNLHANKKPYDDRVMLSKLLTYDVNVKSNYVLVIKRR